MSEIKLPNCPFEIKIHTPCKTALWQWIMERDVPPIVEQIAKEYSWSIDEAIDRCIDIITIYRYGFANRDVTNLSIEDDSFQIVIDKNTFIIGTKEQSEYVKKSWSGDEKD